MVRKRGPDHRGPSSVAVRRPASQAVPLLGKKEDLESLVRLIEAGDVAPVVGRTLPLVEVPEALRYVGGGHARGKTVIVVSA